MLGDDLVGVVHVARFEDAEAAKLFLGLDLGTVRRGGFAVFPIDGQGGFGRLDGFANGPVAVGAKVIVVGKAGVEHRVFLGLGHGVVFALVVVAQTDVFHCSPRCSQLSQIFFCHCFK